LSLKVPVLDEAAFAVLLAEGPEAARAVAEMADGAAQTEGAPEADGAAQTDDAASDSDGLP
jgi:DNA ligase (NAD+)